MARYFAMFLSVWQLTLFVAEIASNPANTLLGCISAVVIVVWIKLTIDMSRLSANHQPRE